MVGPLPPAPAAIDFADRIAAALAAIHHRGVAIAATPPLPPAARIGHDEDAWGPREVLAHLTEAVPYWHGEIERILAADPAGGPAPFGRTVGDAAREGIIERDRTLPAPVLLARLRREGRALTDRLRRLTSADLARVGRHPAWGEITLTQMLERTLAGHLEGHVAQLDSLLGS